ncbi:hypothetical protein ACVWWI_004012 [Bradyrhizobium sp. USDA 3686]|uniref:hypothetical protein n=1 Tax=Bradyrhizobium canariense TaxID=255045 RepID=UPI00195AEA3D|nr:hypothetical protein [Bradyrhizobium canariense]MBM7482676.1 hypothetical protein [Bradyrhizobium canariense]
MAIRQNVMVDAGLQLLTQAGHKIVGDVVAAHHKATVKRLADGGSVQIRTCNLPQLPMVFSEKEAKANRIPSRVEAALSYAYVLAVIRVAPHRVAAFLFPTEVVKKYVLDQLEIGSKDLSLHLDQDIWDKFRLPGAIDVGDVQIERGENDDSPTDSSLAAQKGVDGAITLRDRIEFHRKNIARDAGVAPERVRIEIDFN